jgi:hypothetical protein
MEVVYLSEACYAIVIYIYIYLLGSLYTLAGFWNQSRHSALPPRFQNEFARIFHDGYVPTDEDMFKIRSPTTNITSTTLRFKGEEFTLRDVGGQIQHQDMWMTAFKGCQVWKAPSRAFEYNMLAMCAEGSHPPTPTPHPPPGCFVYYFTG